MDKNWRHYKMERALQGRRYEPSSLKTFQKPSREVTEGGFSPSSLTQQPWTSSVYIGATAGGPALTLGTALRFLLGRCSAFDIQTIQWGVHDSYKQNETK